MEGLVSNFCSKHTCFHLFAPFSTSPGPKDFWAQTLSLWFVRIMWQSSLTLTVSSGKEVEAASFPRATESGYCPRWNSVETEAHSQGTGRGARHESPPQAPLLTCYNPKLPSSLRWDHHSLHLSSFVHRPQGHCLHMSY